VRLIAATSVDLFAAIDRGHFRADLLYRLDVVRIEMPPLAERPEDVPLLVEHFCERLSGAPVRFDAQAMATLAGQPWPGNVRELKNLVDRAQAHFPGQTIGHNELARLLRPTGAAPRPSATVSAQTVPPPRPAAIPAPPPSVGAGIDLKRLLADLESHYIQDALSASGGAIAATAKLLGLQRTTLIEKMRRLQIGTA
jgi:DNA-binding NtrC family response regulator